MQYFYVYILLCSDGSYYTGHTDNIETRIAEHRLGFYDGYTAARLPIQCVFTQIFESRDAAFNAEQVMSAPLVLRNSKNQNKQSKNVHNIQL